jgi:hypothetical protein
VADRGEVAVVDLHAVRGVALDALDQLAAGALDLQAEMRPHDLAAVGDRRVRDGHLQRRGLHVALPDREVDGVAEVVVAQVRAPAARAPAA